uniref:agamous-like MADS-box protein AGL29 n=1 Tax=Erigeron canadensis TaxID=72917 RepID=UPI001CB8C4FE|nr:agamous-like MADS-box protein AGL29 [Erigeron canadensis]
MATAGRKKIELKRIENERQRGVALSKRHSGLFKKAAELATLCGVQIVIILHTIGGKPLSFGTPTIQYVIDKFNNANQYVQTLVNFQLQKLNSEFDDVNEKSINERKRGQVIEESLKVLLGGKTYEEYMGGLDIHELRQLKRKREQQKRNLEQKHNLNCGLSSSSNYEHEVDLSHIEGPKDYLKL